MQHRATRRGIRLQQVLVRVHLHRCATVSLFSFKSFFRRLGCCSGLREEDEKKTWCYPVSSKPVPERKWRARGHALRKAKHPHRNIAATFPKQALLPADHLWQARQASGYSSKPFTPSAQQPTGCHTGLLRPLKDACALAGLTTWHAAHPMAERQGTWRKGSR